MITSSPTFGADHADVDAIEPDPIRLLQMWLPPNDNLLRPLMTLSTIGSDGFPDARNVLVSRVDSGGLHFHTDANSRKTAQLDRDPKAAGALVWPDVGRQLVIVGLVTREPADEAIAAFARRSRYLQVLAWANTTEIAQLSLAERRERWRSFSAAHPDGGTIDAPPTWTGFRLRPLRLTFWRGDPDGPSNRVEYRSTGAGWTVTRLPG